MSEDDQDPEIGWSNEERALGLLWDWLAMPSWAFSDSPSYFDGFSEGVCVLGGIDPDYSNADEDHYDPDFLPGGLALYWAGEGAPPDDWLRRIVPSTLSLYKSLGLKGRVPVKQALLAADKAGLTIPWLEAASADLECALKLPPKLRTNHQIRKQIRRRHSAAAGRTRADKAAKTRFLNDYVKPIFDHMAASGFGGDLRAKSSHRPVATRISDKIYNRITGGRFKKDDSSEFKLLVQEAKKHLADNSKALPALTAFEDNAVQWIKEYEKSSQQKKQ